MTLLNEFITYNEMRWLIMIDLALLGCGGGMPTPERYLTSLLINYKGRKVLIDCGEGTQVSMKLLGWGFKTIDIICITHGHGDHTVGLPGLLATIGNSGRTEPLTIIGPEGITNIVNGLRVVAPYLPYHINIIEAPNDSIYLSFMKEGLIIQEDKNHPLRETIVISTLSLDHSAPCLGYSFYITRSPKFSVENAALNEVPKILWNKLQKGDTVVHEGKTYKPALVLGPNRKGIKISYVTDTRPIDVLPEFIKESDFFICEGTYGDDEDFEKAVKNKHMTFREAAALAKTGNVKELLLTHFSPAMANAEMYINNAKDVFENSQVGEDRYIKTLSFTD